MKFTNTPFVYSLSVNAIIFTSSSSLLFQNKWCMPEFQNKLYAILLWNIVHRGVTNWSIKPKTDTFIDNFFLPQINQCGISIRKSLFGLGKSNVQRKIGGNLISRFVWKFEFVKAHILQRWWKLLSPLKSGAFKIIIQKYCSWF